VPSSALRYRTLGEIGRGGMGSVELVWDEERQEEVARKRILGVGGSSLVRFKREFRSIAQVRHDNLVRLHELDEDAHGPYFTMEYVRGDSLLQHCGASSTFSREAYTRTRPITPDATSARAMTRGTPGDDPTVEASATTSSVVLSQAVTARDTRSGWRCNWERVERIIPQIARALDHLHASGIVHCDLKPSNAIVRGDGVVKVLDFGVVAELAGRRGPGNELVAGTPVYMSPERLLGGAAAPSVDLYALGVMIFEMISGRLPFDPSESNYLSHRLTNREAPSLDSIVTDAPPQYVALCAALLRPDPAQRATTRDVLSALGHAVQSLAPMRPRGEALVGRDVLQAALRGRAEAAGRGVFAHASLVGPSGAGKTALVEWLAREVERLGWIVLRGRASTSEHVAFKALDGAIDDLAGALATRRASIAARTHDALHDAAVLFHALRDLAPRHAPTGTRARGFEALIEILRATAAQSPVLLVVDDVQWADADSIATAAPSRLFLVSTMRDDVAEAHAAAWLRRRGVTPMTVGPLEEDAVRELIARAAKAFGIKPDAATLTRAAAAAAGRPFLAEALGRALAHDPNAATDALGGVVAAIEQASPDARELLTFALAAGDWAPIATLAGAMGRRAGEVETLARELEEQGLVRRDARGGDLGAVDVYHDQVRERALGLLGGGELRGAHDRFVAWLSNRRDVAPSRMVHHLVGAGRAKDAALRARDAARIAEDQRAFGLAAAMYAVVLREPSSDRVELLRLRAFALERIGDYAGAAECWREIAIAVVDLDERNEAIMNHSHALLGGNEIARGYARLNEGLLARGEAALGTSKTNDLWNGLLFALGPFSTTFPDVPPAPPEVEKRALRETAVGMSIAYFDPLPGLRMLRKARGWAAKRGAREATAYCDYMFAYFCLFGARRKGRVKLYERYRARADAVPGERTMPENTCFPQFLDGVVALRAGEWDAAAARIDAAADMLQRAGQVGTLSLMYVLFARTEIELWRQNVFAYERQFARVRAAVGESRTGTMRCQVEMAEAMLALFRGDVEAGSEKLEQLQRSWPVSVRTVQQMLIAMMLMQVARLLGDFSRARDIAAKLEAGYYGFRGTDTLYAGTFAAAAALAEVGALRAGDPEASASRVRRYARIVGEGPPIAATAATRALAYLEEHLGRPEEGLRKLEEAEREAMRLGHPVDAATARYARGLRLGGDAGAALLLSAKATLAEVGVSHRALEAHALP